MHVQSLGACNRWHLHRRNAADFVFLADHSVLPFGLPIGQMDGQSSAARRLISEPSWSEA
jgi:hypothetical protein